MSDAWAVGGEVLHYRLESELGEGGMGQVWAAADTRLGRRVALKVMPEELATKPERLERLRREARTLATLNHSNIVTIYSIEEAEGRLFLAMELVEGKTLGQAIPKQGLTLSRFFDISMPLAEALSAAHDQGITHRDLKPENVMVSADGRIKVLDFGLAKPTASGARDLTQTLDATPVEDKSASYLLTREGDVLGTLPYMSPEQVRGRAVDHRSDIFSLGTVLYEMVTGRRPFGGKSTAALASSILSDAPSSVTELREGLPRHLGRIIRQCLEKRPENRFQSARDVFNQLRDLRDELAPGRDSGSGDRRSSSRPDRSSSGRSSSGRSSRGRASRGRVSSSRVSSSRVSSGRASSTLSPARAAMATRVGPSLLLVATFGVNWFETWAESKIAESSELVAGLRRSIAAAMHQLEGSFSFHGHDTTNAVAIYGFSISYFFVLPVLAVAIAVSLARRPTPAPYRVLALAVTLAYALSLPFYLLFPVPERWAYPDSGAVLLSDLWTTRLIETIRPISGLDNCFPSFHTSLTVVLVAVVFIYRMRLRWSMAALGGTIVLATFVLGIHWIADLVAGAATGALAVALALRLDRRLA